MEPPTKKQRTAGQLSSLTREITPPRQTQTAKVLSSPWQLTRIRDLPPALNQDTVTLGDILGDPLIRECWIFNFCHDVTWVMSHFDPDTRALVKVHFVHGFWKRDHPNRLALEVSPAPRER